ncbi:formylglycine-generating enzyme family protein [Pseudomaricurvus sp. HS19]|uniref:formylglycine-generating enzyme family protein n=1 Tax=Pseudomaricurvus sp. HS19 TaxID=2692626 RepID=UPI00136B1F4E|nr:formylglycine-generating enzyme family protein [Pseudomaricurvus sp. HS19]MYM64348.1 SUMF1/EgtB/PvdO family nonheme iron enzyme [Pseudomaricurvus sp. HS19]
MLSRTVAGTALLTLLANPALAANLQKRHESGETVPANDYIGTLVKITGGSFQMGSSDGLDSERPLHQVTLQSFFMQEHEVTWNQYQPCIDDGVCPDAEDMGWGRGRQPVTNVSWNDVQLYIDWLNIKTGQRFRLPSEAEWEYAARAGSSTEYSWGNRISCAQARYDNFKGECIYDPKTVPVKSFAPNAWGLYDMHGNLREWVQDCWHDSYVEAPHDGTAWIGDGECERRVQRGGSWHDLADSLRAADRHSAPVDLRIPLHGFRLVRDF